jgi:hypothetical protein
VDVFSLTPRITQIENGILQLDRQNDRLFKQLEKRSPAFYSKSDLDVVSFGLVMYEMAVGTALTNLSQIDELTSGQTAKTPTNVPQELVNVYLVVRLFFFFLFLGFL